MSGLINDTQRLVGAKRRWFAIRCFESPFGSEYPHTCSGMRTDVADFRNKAERDKWVAKAPVWPESFRQAVRGDFVVRDSAEHKNIYVREAV